MHPEEDAPTPLLKAMTQQQLGWTSPDVCSLCATGFQLEGRFPGPKSLEGNHRAPLCKKMFCLSTATEQGKASNSKLRTCPAALLTRTSPRQLEWH